MLQQVLQLTEICKLVFEPLNITIYVKGIGNNYHILSHHSSISSVCKYLSGRHLYKDEVIYNIVDFLKKATGIDFFIDINETLEEISKRIDHVFGTSYLKQYPPIVYQNLFKRDKNVQMCSSR